ncbi:hypothetical protein SH139x_003244 [Planctomycetaceae bacterium SH139]
MLDTQKPPAIGLEKLPPQSRVEKQRSGVILIVVLVLIAAISVVVYSFSRMMLTELSIVSATGQVAQQRLLAESAIESLRNGDRNELARLSVPRLANFDPAVSPATQLRLPVRRERGKYAVLQRYPQPNSPPLWGLENESAKLNLNSLTPDRYTREQVIEKLIRYPRVSKAIAVEMAKRLGFSEQSNRGDTSSIDSPQQPREIFQHWEQLIEVPGVTRRDLFGEANRVKAPHNHDAKEDVRDQGWIANWTLVAGESNYREDGQRKIFLNQDNLVQLYDQLLEVATVEEARFVIAWRTTTATYTDDLSASEGPTQDDIAARRKQDVRNRLRAQLGSDQATDSGATAPSPEGNRFKVSNSPTERSRAGIDLNRPPAQRLNSILDLASCQIQILIDGKDTVLVSPFGNDPKSLEQWLPKWEGMTTVHDGHWFNGRINIMQASQHTLETVDGITPELAAAIVAQRKQLAIGLLQGTTTPASISWLHERGLVTTAQLRKIADEITTGGGIYRGVVVGQLENSHTAAAIAIEIDVRGPRFLLRKHLDLLPLTADLRIP